MENKRIPMPMMPLGNSPTSAPVAPSLNGQEQTLEERIVSALRTVYDPEIPVNIHELGLIYQLDVDAEGNVFIRMTLTSPGCPVAGSLPGEVKSRVEAVPGVKRVAPGACPGLSNLIQR